MNPTKTKRRPQNASKRAPKRTGSTQKTEEIPISAQVVSLADVYDALVSDRVYKKAYSHEKAMEMILNGECGMFNPLLLECLVEIQDKVRKELGIKGVNECLEYLEERN